VDDGQTCRVTPPSLPQFAQRTEGLLDPAVTFFSYRASGEVLAWVRSRNRDDRHGPVNRCTPPRRRTAAASAVRWSTT
jgi:hypothetical protein